MYSERTIVVGSINIDSYKAFEGGMGMNKKDNGINQAITSKLEHRIDERCIKFMVDFNEIHSETESKLNQTIQSLREDGHVVYVIGWIKRVPS